MIYNARRALDLLRLGTGLPNAGFREGQEEAIRHIVEGRGRLLLVQKTGWGKSYVYFIATKLLRETGSGPALLISPLLALMRNQIAAAERMGVRAATIHSDNQGEWTGVEAALARNAVDILLISPERLANERFRSRGRIEKTLALLSLESPAPIAQQGTRWQLTAANLSEAFWQRAERLSHLRREEQRQMQEYVSLESGHMEFLIRALDGNPGMIRPPVLPPLPTSTDPALVQEAVAFLRRTSLPIEPRRQWPAGGMLLYHVSGRIAPNFQAQPGRALSVWGDAGWGGLVRQGKFRDRRFADELVAACVRLVREWNPQPAPTWVTCIPSLRRPDLVPDFARRLAAALTLPFHAVLEKTDDRPEQKTMANSTQQARNIDGSLRIIPGVLPTGPVLLVDDMVDSRWTFTVAAWLLRSHGSGDVWPLALAQTGHDQ